MRTLKFENKTCLLYPEHTANCKAHYKPDSTVEAENDTSHFLRNLYDN